MAHFAQQEAQDFVRFTFDKWPSSKIEASKCVVPMAAVYTPLHKFSAEKQTLPYPPLRCRTCSALLCPYVQIDYVGKLWVCPFCFQRNHFPQHYHHMNENNLPPELFQMYSTVEYAPPSERASPPVFLFVLDTCLIEEELTFLKTALQQAIELLPEHALVGLITFGTQVHVHELGSADMPKAYVFRGSKEISKETILDHLGLSPSGRAFQPKSQQPTLTANVRDGTFVSSVKRFLLPQAECEYTLGALLDDLQRDAWPVQPGHRPMRCTGTALAVAAGLLGACVPGTGARIMAFLGGPCTEGPGTIVGKELSDPIRSHKDLEKDTAPYYHKAIKFYQGLSKQLVDQGHVLDLFACALDQVGVAEIKVAVERTGGLVVLAESFGNPVFKESFKRVFEGGESALGLAFNGTFEVLCSKDVKIQGIIGPCASLEKKGPSCSETVIGQGNTSAWKMCGLDSSTSLTIFFDIATSDQSAASQAPGRPFFLQFITQYQHSDGKIRIRATTVYRQWVENIANGEELTSGFDQETAAVVFARLASHKMETEEEFDATRWLDRSLIRLSSRFGHYIKDDPLSFRFGPEFAIFPQFMFNLRRSQFVQVFNNSPDETAYFRMLLNRENVTNSVVMIQPSLITYSLQGPPEPALLDVAAIAVDRILLLDAYFSVVVFHGMNVAQWRNAGYQNQPEYQSFAQLLQAPIEDANAIIAERFPAPRLVVCDHNGSQARFLLAKLNPSATYNSAQGPPPGGDIIFTDDVSLQVFVEHLQRLAVQS